MGLFYSLNKFLTKKILILFIPYYSGGSSTTANYFIDKLPQNVYDEA
jgi:hypothetical protein